MSRVSLYHGVVEFALRTARTRSVVSSRYEEMFVLTTAEHAARLVALYQRIRSEDGGVPSKKAFVLDAFALREVNELCGQTLLSSTVGPSRRQSLAHQKSPRELPRGGRWDGGGNRLQIVSTDTA